MHTLFAVIAAVLLVMGAVVLRNALRSGRVYDCREGSGTEGAWVSRDEDPRKFRWLIASYAAIFGGVIAAFAWFALGGGVSP
jgi:hypothetical protein